MLSPAEVAKLADNLHALGLAPAVHFNIVAAITRALDDRTTAHSTPIDAGDANGKDKGTARPRPKPPDAAWPPLRQAITAALQERGLSRAQLADALAVKQSSMRTWLTPSGNPPGPEMTARLRAWLEAPAAPTATFRPPGNGHAAPAA